MAISTSQQPRTPYGSAGNAKLLAGMRVHMGYGEESIMVNTAHRNGVHRFWTLYIESMGGQLVYFDADRATLFENLNVNDSAPAHAYTKQNTKKTGDGATPSRCSPTKTHQSMSVFLSTDTVSEAQYRGAENV